MDIKWLGHAGFLIESGKTIYIDPYDITKEGLKKADIVLITHSHYDHCSPKDIEKIATAETTIIIPKDCKEKIKDFFPDNNIIAMSPFETREISGIRIKTVPAYNINKEFHKRENNWLGYIVKIGNEKVYHAGDTDFIPEMKALGDENIDYALLPVAGTYTMDAEEAAKATEAIVPAVAIPMHYGKIIGDIVDAEKFQDLAACEVKILHNIQEINE